MKEKETYISPECEALELRLEGVIAASGVEGSRNGYGNGDNENWF